MSGVSQLKDRHFLFALCIPLRARLIYYVCARSQRCLGPLLRDCLEDSVGNLRQESYAPLATGNEATLSPKFSSAICDPKSFTQ